MDKKRTFITFAVGDEYSHLHGYSSIGLANVLKRSIESFSKYPLKIFGIEDFDMEYKPESWPDGYIYIYKVLSCIKALEEYDEVVWIDNDCIATENIDKVWDFKIEGYPLLPKHRFQNFERWPHFKTDYSDPNIMKEGKLRVGVSGEIENSYFQACCMLFDSGCEVFLKNVLGYFDGFNNIDFPYGDESIINLIRWRDGNLKSLGHIFLCSYYFSPYILDEFIRCKSSDEYRDLFDISKRIDGVDLEHHWAEHNRIGLIEDNFDNIMFFHGSKSTELHDRYLSLMIENRKTIHS